MDNKDNNMDLGSSLDKMDTYCSQLEHWEDNNSSDLLLLLSLLHISALDNYGILGRIIKYI